MKRILSLGVLITILLHSYAYAVGTATTTNKATATITSTCSFSMANLIFGEVIPGQPSASTTTNLKVTCSKGLSYQYFANFSQIGSDCIFMAGATKGGKLYYDVTSNNIWLRPIQYNSSNSGGVASVGTGSEQSFVWTGYVNPSSAQNYPYASGCLSKNPDATSGKNPYVAPDTYSDTATVGVVF